MTWRVHSFRECMSSMLNACLNIQRVLPSIVADVTDKQSILALVEEIEKKEGKLHILVNKYSFSSIFLPIRLHNSTPSAGQVGPTSHFFGNPSAPECKDTATLGRALFDSESFDGWASLTTVNLASLFFVSTACLGLLEKATKETPSYTSVIINVTSISGLVKFSQSHVRRHVLPSCVCRG
jgi:NAD(P)-dependent dehydrogenase (short-subunit alcohol dehydrogenase family)